MEQFDSLALYIAVVSLAIAALALVYSARADRRKIGMDVRYSYGIARSVTAIEPWVSEVRLENAKDRSVTIYKIYLEVGHGLYVLIEDFSADPLTLNAYSVYQQRYDSVDLYAANMTPLTGILDEKSSRQRIVLTTSQGRYYPKRVMKVADDPFIDALRKNHATAVARPERVSFKGRHFGSATMFVVELTRANGECDLIPIYKRDHEVRKFSAFLLTKESISSKQALEAFLSDRITEGKLSCQSMQVFDLRAVRREAFKNYGDSVAAVPLGWFTYRIIGKYFTILRRLKLRRQNKLH